MIVILPVKSLLLAVNKTVHTKIWNGLHDRETLFTPQVTESLADLAKL